MRSAWLRGSLYPDLPGLAIDPAASPPVPSPVPMSSAQRIPANVLFNGARIAVSLAAALFASVIVARSLGPVDMGLYSYVMWLIRLVAALSNLGLPAALTKYTSEYLGRGDAGMARHLAWRLLRVRFVTTGMACCVASLVCWLWLPAIFHTGAVVLVLGILAGQTSLEAFMATLEGAQRFDRIAKIALAGALSQVGFVALAARLHMGVNGMLAAGMGAVCVACFLAFSNAKRGLGPGLPAPSISDCEYAFQRARRFSVTISCLILLDMIVWQRSEVFFLKRWLTLPEIAFYGIAFSIAQNIGEASTPFTGVLLPLYSGIFGNRGVGKELAVAYNRSIKYVQMLMAPLCVFCAIAAGPLVRLLYGPNYLPMVPVLQVLLVSLAVTSMCHAGSALVQATENQGPVVKYGTAIAILNIALDCILIPKAGALGAALANSGAQVTAAIVGLVYTETVVCGKFPWGPTIKIYLATVLAAAPSIWAGRAGTGNGMLVGALVVGLLAYPLLLVAFRQLGSHELAALKRALAGSSGWFGARFGAIPD